MMLYLLIGIVVALLFVVVTGDRPFYSGKEFYIEIAAITVAWPAVIVAYAIFYIGGFLNG